MTKFLCASLLALFLAAPFARADDALDALDSESGGKTAAPESGENKPKIIYRKKTAVSFDDAVVEGTANNPEGVYVVTPPEKQFGSLLKLRPNFHRELMRDALLLK